MGEEIESRFEKEFRSLPEQIKQLTAQGQDGLKNHLIGNIIGVYDLMIGDSEFTPDEAAKLVAEFNRLTGYNVKLVNEHGHWIPKEE